MYSLHNLTKNSKKYYKTPLVGKATRELYTKKSVNTTHTVRPCSNVNHNAIMHESQWSFTFKADVTTQSVNEIHKSQCHFTITADVSLRLAVILKFWKFTRFEDLLWMMLTSASFPYINWSFDLGTLGIFVRFEKQLWLYVCCVLWYIINKWVTLLDQNACIV